MSLDAQFDLDDVDTSTHPSVRRVKLLSNLLDEAVPIPGTDRRIGLDPILGVLPVAGDSVAAVMSLYIILEAALAGVPPTVLVRMLINVGVDTAVGSIPVLGTVFDAVWKANTRNVELLAEHVDANP
jgi:hypothetical protein